MNCTACGHESPPGSKFCLECGRAFAARCAQCGADLPPTAKFCNECGQRTAAQATPPEREPASYTPKHLADKILQSKSALEGERKQVTVLFADVKGSMELAEQVDPEEWHRILDRFFQILADGVHRFEGTVNQYTGDGIMALFGAPIAHEDHAQRACYAALHLREELRRYANDLRLSRGLSFSVRMGLNSGEVVVGKIGDDLRMDYTAQGHTVGLAARMEQIAAPDRVYLTDHTARLVAGYFALEDLGELRIEGAESPMRVHELDDVGELRTRFDVSRERGLSRFVGRDDDLEALEAALARCHEGHGQVVGLVGEAGVGKSRLCFEFTERCRARGLRVLEGRGAAHGKNIPLLPILEVFRAYFGIAERDDDRATREKIAGRLLLLDEGFREVLPLLFEFLGVSDPEQPPPRMDPEARQRQLFGVLRRLVQSGRRESPIVTLIEDLHWIDLGSEAWVAEWVDAISASPGLLLVNFRPEYHAEWMQKSYYRQLPLAPLGAEAIRELLDDLLGSDASIAGLAETIHARTGGNPFFAEEVVRSLTEAGHLEGTRGGYRLTRPVEELAIPSSVESMIAARIDRIAEREKQVLQTAAVIGGEFSEPILEAVSELSKADLAGALGALKASEFIYERALYPVAEYGFKHALTQEVALRSQLQERRRRVHADVARAIEAASPDKVDAQAALLAHHWEGAGEPLRAGQLHHQAAEWVATSDPEGAVQHWRRALGLLETLPESPETLTLGGAACVRILMQAWRTGLSDEEATRYFEEGKARASRSGDLRLLALVHWGYGATHGFAGELEPYARYSSEAARIAAEAGDAELEFALQVPLVYTRFLSGHLQEALILAERALESAPRETDLGEAEIGFDPHALLVGFKSTLLSLMGRLDEAERWRDRADEVAHQRESVEALAFSSMQRAYLAGARGEGESEARARAHRTVDLAERRGSPLARVFAYQTLGMLHSLSEDWRAAAGALEKALAIARERRTGLEVEAGMLAELSAAQLGMGESARARETAEQALAIVQRQGARAFECRAELALARALLHGEGRQARSAIEGALGRARALAEETGAKSVAPLIHVEVAELARLLGDGADRERHLREAHRLFVEMGATGHAERVARELGEGG
jgi:class 3 adenylate cyclase/tetratricopeptide (TPR) repeat protein